MALTSIEFITGSFCLGFVVVSIFVGLFIMSKYFKYKQRNFLLVGLTWIILSEVWWSSSFSFIAALITGSGLTDQLYFLIGNLFVPMGIMAWMVAFTDMKFKSKQKLILGIFGIISIMYYAIILSLIFIDVSLVGTMRGNVDGDYTPTAMLFLLTGLFTIVITGLIFAKESLRSENSEIKLKGKFLILAFISFGAGAFLDGIKPYLFPVDLLDIVLLINRIILISSAIEFYFGFVPPDWLKSLLLK